jgi:serine/threonine-protein kinase RsbW
MAGAGVTDRLEIKAHTRNLARVREFVRGAVRRCNLPVREQHRVVLAVDEAVSNTVLHGYSGHSGGQVEVQIESEPGTLRFTIIDAGMPYDVARGANRRAGFDLRRHIQSGARRGLGLFIMRKVMDEIRYSSRDGQQNQLTLVKHVVQQA